MVSGRTSLKERKSLSVSTQCYLLIGLQIIGFFVFTIYPILWAARKAWYFYDGYNEIFVGWDNFKTIFSSDSGAVEYWKTWLTTFRFTVYKTFVEIPVALLLATLLSKRLRGSDFFRSMFYLPNVISVAIIGVMFSNLFQYFGVMNGIFVKVGDLLMKWHLRSTPIQPVDWFANKNSAMAVLVIGSTWQTFGINVLYFCAALNNVPKDVYEAATVDGAGSLRQFFKITMPMIAPVFSTLMLLSINGTLHTSDFILVMTGGQPGTSTHTVGSYMISKFVPGFADASSVTNIGYGCALAIVTSVIYSSIAVIYLKATKKLKNIY